MSPEPLGADMTQPTSPAALSRQANDASLMLDLIRALAAQAVCVGHAGIFFGVFDVLRRPPRPYMQNLGVIIFFWLSGFLIAHALVSNTRRPEYTFKSYLLDRLARIYSAYLPALFVVYAIDAWLQSIGRYEFPAYLTPNVLWHNILMLQGYFGPYRELVTSSGLGSDGPLWTLSVEFHIYLFVGSIFFLFRARHWIVQLLLGLTAVATAGVPIHYLSEGISAEVGTGLFLLWVAGFGCYYIGRHGLPNIPRWLTSLGSAGLIWWYWSVVQQAHEYAPQQYPILAAALLLLTCAALRTRMTVNAAWLQRIVRLMADSSYSLYLVHYTILYALTRVWQGTPLGGALTGILAANLFALAFASVTEFHHKRLARWLRSWLDAKSVRVLAMPPANSATEPKAELLHNQPHRIDG